MGGRGSGRTRGAAAPLEYTREMYEEILKRVPRDAILAGKWKVSQERPGRNGGLLDASVGAFDYDAEQDPEEEVRARYVGVYGGGTYTLRFHDANRRRVEAIPPLRFTFVGGPKDQPDPGQAAAGEFDPLKEEQKENQALAVTYRNQLLQAKIRDLQGGQKKDDPMTAAVVEILRAKIAEKPQGSSFRDLVEMKMLLRELHDEPKRDDGVSEAVKGIMTAVSGLVTAQSSMATQQMSALNGLVTNSVGMMQMMASMGQTDPWLALIQQGPELLDRLGGFVASTVREVKESYIDIKNLPPSEADKKGARPGLPGPRGRTPQGSNKFIRVIYENYQHKVPPDITADQVQYFLPEEQLRGVVTTPPDQVLAFLEQNGCRKAFTDDPKLREYVGQVVIEIQNVAQESAKEKEAEPNGEKEKESAS